MDPRRWQDVVRLYESAVEMRFAEREPFLRSACASDSGLRREVEEVLAEDQRPALIDEPVFAAFDDNTPLPSNSVEHLQGNAAMTPERWREVTRIYGAVVARPADVRAAAVDELCGADGELRAEVESLLAEESASGVVDRPVTARPSLLNVALGLPLGTQIGAFRIEELLGVGGMGEVYRARDTKLNRDVAIKILPPAFAADPDRLARFKREAQMLAALNHPNIAAIYGLEGPDRRDGQEGRSVAIVMELVDGPTLADRIERGPLPLEDALTIARQIAEALEAAHDQGIVHRDLKPANIKVRDDGTVKVLDFGLAKINEAGGAGEGSAAGRGNLTNSPTITTPAMTAAGIILGTAAYMSPEQAKGKPADKRSDIWAFGCVLYEMLTGTRAFDGEDVTDTLAAILRGQPDWQRLPTDTPASVHRLLGRALARDRRQRLADAATLRIEIDDAKTGPAEAQRPGRIGITWWMWAALLVMTGILAWALLGDHRSPQSATDELRIDVAMPPTSQPASIAISPDGLRLLYSTNVEGQSQLWLRSLVTNATRPLAGTEGGLFPFWSADGREIGFFAAGELELLDLAGGAPRSLGPGAVGGSWNADGTILFATRYGGALMRTDRTAGKPYPATKLDPRHGGHRFPNFLPDGRHFLFFVAGVPDVRGVYLGTLDREDIRMLVPSDSHGVFAAGHILFVRGDTLLAQRFDTNTLTIAGDSFTVAEHVSISPRSETAMTAAPNGTIAFRGATPADAGRRQFVWFDRSGKELGTVGDVETTVASISLSEDEKLVAFGRVRSGNPDVWVLELARGVPRQITFDETLDTNPVWSPDGQRLVFNSSRGDSFHLVLKSLAGTDTRDLTQPPSQDTPSDWSPDGKFLLYRRYADLWIVPVDSSQPPRPFVATRSNERDGQFSPDGKWIAYQSDESGRFEIYVKPFLDERPPVPLSTGGGTQVRWRKDGRELFYIALDGALMASPFDLDPDGSIKPPAPVRLFQTRVPGGPIQAGGTQQYAVATNGQRFLVNTLLEEPASSPVTLILNWRSQQTESRP